MRSVFLATPLSELSVTWTIVIELSDFSHVRIDE